MRKRSAYKTARCVLRFQDEFMLAVHSSFWARKVKRWGLPGGNIERGESPRQAVQRELEEELELYHGEFLEIGAYTYKGAQHMVFGADIDQRITDYDEGELLDLAWFDLNQIQQLSTDKRLHAGYEALAIQKYLQVHNVNNNQ